MRASNGWVAALALMALLLSVAPALARACHSGHGTAAAAVSAPMARQGAAHHRDTLPCCAGPSCANLVPLPRAGCPAAQPATADLHSPP